jgi:formylglycine-generating enzyme required for sulfatase activity
MNFRLIHVISLTCFYFSSFFCASAQKFPDMIKVEGGTFMMGLEEKLEDADSVSVPLHAVTVKTFNIGKTEVTVGQWRAFCNAVDRQMPNPPNWGWIDNHPIVNISWDDALAYCKWLSDSSKRTYRLPTEAEWEFAARGGKKTKEFLFSGGQSMYNIGWYDENSNAGTQPVAQKRPNELGIFDMSGNVWEWCQDWFGEYPSEPQINPQGSETTQYFKVLRGGSWNYVLSGCRIGDRSYFSPESRLNDFGFRVVMEDVPGATNNNQNETPEKSTTAPQKGGKD